MVKGEKTMNQGGVKKEDRKGKTREETERRFSQETTYFETGCSA
jgi:hypothetical protein